MQDNPSGIDEVAGGDARDMFQRNLLGKVATGDVEKGAAVVHGINQAPGLAVEQEAESGEEGNINELPRIRCNVSADEGPSNQKRRRCDREGGQRGGAIVAAGTPEDVAEVAASYTGQYLRAMLEKKPKRKKAG